MSIRSFFSSENWRRSKMSTCHLTFLRFLLQSSALFKRTAHRTNRSFHREVIRPDEIGISRCVSQKSTKWIRSNSSTIGCPLYAGRSMVYSSRRISHRLRRHVASVTQARLPLLLPSQRATNYFIYDNYLVNVGIDVCSAHARRFMRAISWFPGCVIIRGERPSTRRLSRRFLHKFHGCKCADRLQLVALVIYARVATASRAFRRDRYNVREQAFSGGRGVQTAFVRNAIVRFYRFLAFIAIYRSRAAATYSKTVILLAGKNHDLAFWEVLRSSCESCDFRRILSFYETRLVDSIPPASILNEVSWKLARFDILYYIILRKFT